MILPLSAHAVTNWANQGGCVQQRLVKGFSCENTFHNTEKKPLTSLNLPLRQKLSAALFKDLFLYLLDTERERA